MRVAQWTKVMDETELDEQARVEIDGLAYAIFRLEDGVYALDDVWKTISPFSGAVNTITFVIVASFSLYFNRLQKG